MKCSKEVNLLSFKLKTFFFFSQNHDKFCVHTAKGHDVTTVFMYRWAKLIHLGQSKCL